MTQPPLNPRFDWEPWERVARDLGDQEHRNLDPLGHMTDWNVVEVDDPDYVGDLVDAEPACKRIVAAEEALDEALGLIHRLTAQLGVENAVADEVWLFCRRQMDRAIEREKADKE